MVLDVSNAVDKMLKRHMASGRYSSQNDLLLRALDKLAEYDETVADIQSGIEDETAGRVTALREVDEAMRRKYGIARG